MTQSLTLANYHFFELATKSFWSTLVIGILVFVGLTSYPIEFWRKTPFMFGNLLGYFLFHELNLSPSEANCFMALQKTSLTGPLHLISYSYLVLNLMVIFVVNTLLGRRTGHLLSILLRTIYFLLITAETTSVLTIVRLLSVVK